MSDVEAFSYPCQKVTGPGQLCGLPCEPGFMQCLEHRRAMPRREIVKLMEAAQDRTLLKVEEALDDTIDGLISLSKVAEHDSDRLKAIDKLLTLAGFANVKIDAEVGVTLRPDDRDKVLINMVRQLTNDPEKMRELEEKFDVIDTTATEG